MYSVTSFKLYRQIKFLYNPVLYFPVPLGHNITAIGWGYRKSGLRAKKSSNFLLLEDGFIRSVGLGVTGSPSFSVVEDNKGIYYDATTASKLENILNRYGFEEDEALMAETSKAISLILKHNISKYNNTADIKKECIAKYSLAEYKEEKQNQRQHDRILIVAQTAGDASLKYGLAEPFTTKQMIEDAIHDNPEASVYIKIHPDVLSGKKASDIRLEEIPKTCYIIDEDINPIALLKHFQKVYTKTSGMGMEALILGLEVHCYGMPYYAGWGLTQDKTICRRRKRTLTVEKLFAGAYILYTRYYNPYTKKETDIMETIKNIIAYRKRDTLKPVKRFFFGFSRWKHKHIPPFFAFDKNEILFVSSFSNALEKGLTSESEIYIWGKKPFPEIEKYAKKNTVPLFRIEDGFIRSVSLGSDLTKAYSLVVDSRGIYFDPTEESDLEHLLNTYHFDDKLLERARYLQKYLVENRISKYNSYKDKQLELKGLKEHQTVVVVPGQVEDDASIKYGAKGMTNLELLKKTRINAPDAFIVYKPHPDVLAGNRKGHIQTQQAMQYCNAIIADASLDSVLELADEVHTMTSLVGFEALIRHKKVYTYGLPFYAGWGLTEDEKKCERRKVKRTLDALVAAAFILYPRYINPKTNKPCEIEVVLHEIDKEKTRYNTKKIYRLYIDSRNMISRKIQLLIKAVLGE